MPLLAPTMDYLGRFLTGRALPVDNTLSDLRWNASNTAVQSNAGPHPTGDFLTRDGFESLSRLSG